MGKTHAVPKPSPSESARWSKLYLLAGAGCGAIVLALLVNTWRSGAWAEYSLRHMREGELRARVAAHPNDSRAQRHWAQRQLERGELAEAEQGFRRAVETDPTDVRAWTGWGNATLALGRVGPALEILKRAAQQWPENPDAQFGVATTYSAVGDMASAIPHWRAGLRHDPRKAEAWIALGQALETHGQAAEAEEAFAAALRLKPGDVPATLGRARCLLALKRGKEARPLVDAILADDPSHLEARMLLGDVLIARGDPESRGAGMKELARAGQFHPEAPGPNRRIAELWMEEGAYPDAAQAFAQAADREPSNETHLERAADAYRALKLPEQEKTFRIRAAQVRQWKQDAQRLLQQAQSSPNDIRPLLEHARLCERLAWHREAAADYRHVLAIRPTHALASRRLRSLEKLLQTQEEEGHIVFSKF